jgi:hypothetical protein
MSDPLDTARLRERLIALTRDLVLIPGSEERSEELTRAIHWVRNHLEGLDGVVIDLFESEGILHLKLESTGAACHAARPWLGHNALEKLMTCAEAIQKLFPPFNADLFHWHSTCSITRIDTW